MPFVLILIALLVGGGLYSCIDNYAKKKHAGTVCDYYINHIKSEGSANGASLEVSESVLTYTKAYLPLLYPKWERIRSDYTRISGNINLMEVRYRNLVNLNELNKHKIDNTRPKSYQVWLDKQNKELQVLKKAHEQIRQAVEKYYAEAQIRSVDSDAEMQSIVGGLEKSVHVVLAEHGYDFKNTPKCTDSKEKKAPESEQRQKEQGSVASESSTSDTKQENKKAKYAKTEKVTKTRVKKKQPSARQKEIEHYLNLVQCYNHKLRQAADILESICDPNAARQHAGYLLLLSDELLDLKQQCNSFSFHHVKDFDSEVAPALNSSSLMEINKNTRRISNRLDLFRQSRWLHRGTLRNLSILVQ